MLYTKFKSKKKYLLTLIIGVVSFPLTYGSQNEASSHSDDSLRLEPSSQLVLNEQNNLEIQEEGNSESSKKHTAEIVEAEEYVLRYLNKEIDNEKILQLIDKEFGKF